MPINYNIKKSIENFARTISRQDLGLVSYLPDERGIPARCFENVHSYIKKNGGREQFGWMFQQRLVTSIPEGSYLIAVHHAVWLASNGHLMDITPFHNDPKHHPLIIGNDVIFLVDDKAIPYKSVAPLPSRFYALSDNVQLIKYVQELNNEEEKKCKKIYYAHFC